LTASEAIAIYEPLLTALERILRAEDPDTLSTRNNLAGAYQDTGRTQEAITIYEPLLAAVENTIGPQHPNTLSTRHNLASAYQDARRTDDAKRANPVPRRIALAEHRVARAAVGLESQSAKRGSFAW
jgi:tetratricopeptide (TPR) repeat protein